MTKKDRILLAATIADCLQKHSALPQRAAIISVKDAIADMLYEQGHEPWSEFQHAWREQMENQS